MTGQILRRLGLDGVDGLEIGWYIVYLLGLNDGIRSILQDLRTASIVIGRQASYRPGVIDYEYLVIEPCLLLTMNHLSFLLTQVFASS